MKRHLLLLACLISFTTHPKQSLGTTDMWKNRYGVHRFKPSDKAALASGLYYLLKDKGNNQAASSTVDQFYKMSQKTFHYDCRNAYLHAYEKSTLAAHKETEKTKAWMQTLLPYYTTVLGMLDRKDLTISFGKDQGKKLPATLFELDRALNPQPVYKTFHIKVPGFSFQWHYMKQV